MPLTKKQKILIGVVAVVLLLILIIVVSVVVTKGKKNKNKVPKGAAIPAEQKGKGPNDIKSKEKMVEELCASTNYKETCQESLKDVESTDPKELIKATFNAAEKNIGEVIKNSSLLQAAATDALVKGAFEVCKEVLQNSIKDLKRSFDRVDKFDDEGVDQFIFDLKTWLSGAISHQQICIDAFDNTTGDTGEKMKELLRTASELSSNSLAVVDELKRAISELMGDGATSRRLLSDEEEIRYLYETPMDYVRGQEPPIGTNSGPNKQNNDVPNFVSKTARRLMAARSGSVVPDVVVAQDGSGQFKTISDVFKHTHPPSNNKTYIIHVKAGVYKEYVVVPPHFTNVVLMGDGPDKTKITGNRNYADGVQTYSTMTLAVDAENFMAKDISIENTAGPQKRQALAVRVSGDKAVFHNVRFDGFQDTLCASTYRQFYRDCTITGTIDFIFGDALAVFQNCRIVVRKPENGQECMITAQGRLDPRSISAFILQNADIVAEPELLSGNPPTKSYLGRPWKMHSRTIIMNSDIGGFIEPEGWSPWRGTFGLDTLYYGEYDNRGAGSDLSQRVKWKGIRNITPELAETFTVGAQFKADQSWIKKTGVPYYPGLKP